MNMLQDRTVNIMMIAKRFPIDKAASEIAKYMAEECGSPADKYTDSIIFSIVKNAFFDWLWCCDKNRTMALIRTYFDCIDEPSQLNRMLIALALSQVAEIDNDGNCHEICGFHETDFTKKLKATEKAHDIEDQLESIDAAKTEKHQLDKDGCLYWDSVLK